VAFTVLSSAPVSSVSLAAAPATTAPTGASATFTAEATGGGGSLEYKFFRKNPGSTTWITVQDYASNPVLAWDTTGETVGKYTVMVHVRTVGSPYVKEASQSLYYTLTAP
jgi:hypothetical protein